MPVFKIHHITRYQYERPVTESVNEIRITPFVCNEQEVLQHDLTISKNPEIHSFNDYWGNKTGLFNILEPHQDLTIESKLIVRTTLPEEINFEKGFSSLKEDTSQQMQLIELMRPIIISEQSKINKITKEIFHEKKSIAKIVEHASEYIFNHFKYKKGITTIETTVDEILHHHGGVCQDFAHVLLQILRSLGIPCRYVSGYICPNKNGMRGEGATHAWIEAWIPDYGWAGIDPTNNVWVTNNHIKLAVGRNFSDCTPVKGAFKGTTQQDLYVLVSVGYEDGHVFEETTHVQMDKQQKISNKKSSKELEFIFSSQQQ